MRAVCCGSVVDFPVVDLPVEELFVVVVGASARTRLAALTAAVCVGVVVLGTGSARAATVMFGSTGAQQQFVVPSGVETVHVVALGGRGFSELGGFGAVVSADIPVTAGEVMYVEVGGNGRQGFGGFNGGGSGAGGGGGASDVRTVPASSAGSLASRLIVAGAGGGGGGYGSYVGVQHFEGGAAGAPGQGIMLNGGGAPGGAGTLTMGGACQNCLPSGAGSLGLGGDAPGGNERGGGGGGGLYGGGAGQGGALLGGAGGGGGGGGSSGFAASARNTSVGADATGVPSVTIVYVSDAFKLSRPAVSRGGTITLPITVAGAGRITAVGTARVPARLRGRSRPKTGGRITYGAATVSPVSSGTVRLPIKPKGVVKRLLRDGATLTVTIRVTFAPNGGSKNTQTIHVSVNGGKKRRHS